MTTGRPSRPRDESERAAERGRAQVSSVNGKPLEYFPAAFAVLVPGLGQIVNGRHIPRQWIKGFLFAWFFWYFIFRNPILPAAAMLFVASVIDFVWIRSNYNRRLAAAKNK